MKIAIFCYDLLARRPTGTKTLWREVLGRWVTDHADDVELTVVTRTASESEHMHEILPPGGWRTAEIRHASWKTRSFGFLGNPHLTPTIGPHDVYLSGSHWPLGKRDRPFVGVLLDVAPLDPAARRKTLKMALMKWLFKRAVEECCRRADGLASISQRSLDHLREVTDVELPPHRAILLGVDAQHWADPVPQQTVDELLRQWDVPTGAPYVLALGQHVLHKNFGTLLRAFHRHVAAGSPDTFLLSAGGFNQETAGYREYIEQHGLGDRVRLLGFVSDDRLRGLMQRAAVFAFPSVCEGFGLPALEALAAGVPVVCSNAGALPEVVQDAALTVSPFDADGLGDALNRALTDDALRSRLVAKGTARAQSMNWDRCADAYLQFVRETVQGYAQPGGPSC